MKKDMVARIFRRLSFLKDRNEKIEGANWAAVKGGKLTNLTFAERIFSVQLVAISSFNGSLYELGRVLSFIIIDEAMNNSVIEDAEKENILDVFRRSVWGLSLLREYDEETSQLVKYAKSCRITEIKFFDTEFKTNGALVLEEDARKFLEVSGKLIETVREGWIDWSVSADIETVANHVVMQEFMSLIMNDIYNYHCDNEYIILGSAISHLGNSKTGDFGEFDMSENEKTKRTAKAFDDIAGYIPIEVDLWSYYQELMSKKSRNASMVYQAGKLATDFQALWYNSYVDMMEQSMNIAMENEFIRNKAKEGADFVAIWVSYSLEFWGYDDNFKEVAQSLIAK